MRIVEELPQTAATRASKALHDRYPTPEARREYMRELAQRRADLARVGKIFIDAYERIVKEAETKSGGAT